MASQTTSPPGPPGSPGAEAGPGTPSGRWSVGRVEMLPRSLTRSWGMSEVCGGQRSGKDSRDGPAAEGLDAEGVTGGGRGKPAGSTHLAGTGMGRPPSTVPAPFQGVGAQGARGRVAPVPWDLRLSRGGKSSRASAARIGPHGRGWRPRSPGVWGGRQHSTRSRRGCGCRLTRPRLRPAGRRRS